MVNCQLTLAWMRSRGRLPSRDLVAQDLEGGDAAVEALTDHDAELDLGDVEPTAVLGRVDELEAVPQGLGLRAAERPRRERPGRWVFRLSITSVILLARGGARRCR